MYMIFTHLTNSIHSYFCLLNERGATEKDCFG